MAKVGSCRAWNGAKVGASLLEGYDRIVVFEADALGMPAGTWQITNDIGDTMSSTNTNEFEPQ